VTIFITLAEAFQSRIRGFADVLSAAVGEFGAIFPAPLFNRLATPMVIGLASVLWIFFACNPMGAISTYFLIPETKNRDADVIDFVRCDKMPKRRKRV
jgi:MFS transporter, PHS family, inorganic phosphate transporter